MERLERKEREFNMRRSDILEKAEKAFSEKGFHNVTMAEIARTSGFSTGSLYQFFAGKENLYTTMIREKLDVMYSGVKDATNTASGIIEKIEALIDSHLQFAENNPDFCRLFARGESAALSDAMTDLRQHMIDDYFSHIVFIEDILNDGIESGVLRALPPRDMAHSLVNLIRTSLIEWMLDPAKESPRHKKEFIMDIFLHGVRKND